MVSTIPTLLPQSLFTLGPIRRDLVFPGWIRQHAYIGYAVVHLLEVWFQSRVAGRKASQVDLKFGSGFLILTHNPAQGIGTEAIHRRLAVLSVDQAVELFQLLQSSPNCRNNL